MTSTTPFDLPGWNILAAAQRAGAVIDVEVWRFTIRPSTGTAPPNDMDAQSEDGADIKADGADAPARRHPPRGRPILYDWPAVIAKAETIAAAGEMPEVMADLIRDMTEWCREQGWRYLPSEDSLYAKLRDIHRRALDGREVATQVNLVEVEIDNASPKRGAGRPDLYDWGAIMTYVDGLASAGGAPGKMADLVRMVTDWCRAQGWRYIPSDRRLNERLNERRRALERQGRRAT